MRRAPSLTISGLLAALCLMLAGAPAIAAKLALVVGNNAYAEVPALSAAVPDARAMSAALTAAGYSVDIIEDGSKRQMSRALSAFEGRIAPGDTVLFHYSGHGFEINGQNWLLPVDVPKAQSGEEGLVKDESFNAADVIDRFRARGARTVVAIIDACRDNPFAGSGTRSLGGTRGLARMDASGGVFIIFSAGAKELALDNLGPGDREKTSIFVRSVLPLIGRQDLSLIDLAKDAQEKVRGLARVVGREQTPAYYDGIVGRVTITGEPVQVALAPVPVIAPVPAAPPPAGPPPQGMAEEIFWQTVKNSGDPAMVKAYLDQVAAGVFPGSFRSLAEQRLASLAPPAAPASPAAAARPAEASSPEVAACDAAAAAPDDAERPAGVTGAPDGAVGANAIEACLRASTQTGAPRRVSYQLYRGYEAKGDTAEAIRWLRKGADDRHPLSIFELGRRYRSGKGVARNFAEARLMFDRAISAGVEQSVIEIAGMYAAGEGAAPDLKMAARLYELGVKGRVPAAFSQLGRLHVAGRGVARDRVRACALFREGASLGDHDAREAVGSYCR